MKQRRENNRDMCAELLTVRWTDHDGLSQSVVATLEDISATGACLQMEHSILPGTEVCLHYPNGEYMGKVKYCIYQDLGYLLGIAFDEGYRWSKTDFEPLHLLELPMSHPKA
ncbi:MAG TPA: PilZ domain-containing protein [Terriglobia bacterium]|nr:PilZ domain-containing protein [Terriglobia bacterium]